MEGVPLECTGFGRPEDREQQATELTGLKQSPPPDGGGL